MPAGGTFLRLARGELSSIQWATGRMMSAVVSFCGVPYRLRIHVEVKASTGPPQARVVFVWLGLKFAGPVPEWHRGRGRP